MMEHVIERQATKVWICSFLPAETGRGLEKIVNDISVALKNSGYAVEVVDAATAGCDQSLAMKVRPYVAWRIGRIVNSKAKPEDVIICNNFFSWNCRRGKSVVIYHQTEMGRAIALAGKRNRLRNLGVRLISARLDRIAGKGRRIVAVSNTVKEELRKYYALETDRVILNSVDLNAFKPIEDKNRLREELGLPKNRFLVLYAGPSDMQKGLGVILDEILPAMNGRQHLVLVSDIQNSPEGVTVVGRVGFERMAMYLQACDVLLMPSYYEGFGLTVAEGLACGLPCITSATGLGRHLAEDTILGKYVVSGMNARRYVELIESLYDSKETHTRVSSAARAFAERVCDPAVFADAYVDLVDGMHGH
jgi:glycosyltransferase involved in cell wall biosynthesis